MFEQSQQEDTDASFFIKHPDGFSLRKNSFRNRNYFGFSPFYNGSNRFRLQDPNHLTQLLKNVRLDRFQATFNVMRDSGSGYG